MSTLRKVKADSALLRSLLIDLGRIRSLRDPLAHLAELDLTSVQLHAVLWLGVEGGLTASVLAQRIGSSLPACTGIVDRLEKMDIVMRERAEDDRRIVRMHLTPKGEKMFTLADEAISAKLELLLGVLSDEDRHSLLSIVERLVAGVRERGEREES